MITPLTIDGVDIGPARPAFLIAEAGVNHNGDMELAHRLIEKAVEAGANAVKFQSFKTEELITPDAPKTSYQIETTGEPGSQFEMLKALELSAEQHGSLKKHCEDAGITYLCTPYDRPSVEMLERLGVSAYKIASTDTTNTPFLRFVASKHRPLIVSTGMSTLAEVEDAVAAVLDGGAKSNFALLHCTSEYPAPIRESNLRAINTLEVTFRCPVGFSDHTPGIGASPWAVAVGACVVEKHFTLDRSLPGPDHRASLEPDELREWCDTIRSVESAMGDGIKRPMPSEAVNKGRMQKCLVARRNVPAGALIKEDDIAAKRGQGGLPPSWLDYVIGRRAAYELLADEAVKLSSVDWESDPALRQPIFAPPA